MELQYCERVIEQTLVPLVGNLAVMVLLTESAVTLEVGELHDGLYMTNLKTQMHYFDPAYRENLLCDGKWDREAVITLVATFLLADYLQGYPVRGVCDD